MFTVYSIIHNKQLHTNQLQNNDTNNKCGCQVPSAIEVNNFAMCNIKRSRIVNEKARTTLLLCSFGLCLNIRKRRCIRIRWRWCITCIVRPNWIVCSIEFRIVWLYCSVSKIMGNRQFPNMNLHHGIVKTDAKSPRSIIANDTTDEYIRSKIFGWWDTIENGFNFSACCVT